MTNNSISFVSLSLENGSGMTRQWIDHGSTIPRKLFSLLFVLFSFGVGNVWGATTYKLTQVTSVSAGNKYVFVQNGHAMNNSCSSSALQTVGTYKTTGLAGNESYVWTLETATGGFYMKNVSLNSNQYLNNTSSTNVSFGNKNSVWTFSFSEGIALIQNSSNSNRFLGYTSSTSYAYKAYATTNLGSYEHAIRVYKLEEEPSCSSSITITKGDNPANGTFVLTTSGSVCIDEGNASTIVNATPNSNYHLSDVTSTGGGNIGDISNNSCTVSNIGANTTINVTFAPDPQYTVTWVAGSNSSFSTQTNYAGTDLTSPGTPDASTYCPGDKVFIGWTASQIVGEADVAPFDLFTSVAGKSIPVGGITYYAVFAKSSIAFQDNMNISGTNTVSSRSGWASFSSAYGNSGCIRLSTSSAVGSMRTNTLTALTSATTQISFKIKAWSGTENGQVTLSASKGTIANTSFTATSTSFTEVSTTITGGDNTTTITFTGASGKRINIKDISIGEVSNYATSCCQPLASINGSVSLAQLTTANPTKLKATWTMNAETGIDSYDLEIYDSNDNKVKTIEGYTSGDEITGLTPCTSYYAKLYTVSQGSPYCDGGLISTSTPLSTIGYTYGITKTNVSLKTGADEEANTCVGDFSAQYQAAAGYALPTTLTVTGASAHTWSISEGVGTLSIDADDVTGNVTTTIAGTCVPPTFTVHPASKLDYLATDVATALNYTASAAGASLTQQWQVSDDNDSWDNITGDAGTAATYTPNIASAGTKYYRVIVTSACGESKTSDVATITSTAPSGYCISVFNSSKNETLSGFSNGGDGNEYTLAFTIPGKDGESHWPQYWIGENNAWASAYSANATFGDMQILSANNSTLGLAEGATGKLHIWDDNKASGSNLHVKFEPDGYGFRWGDHNSDDWTAEACTKAFTVDANNANTYWTDLVTLDGTNNTAWDYYVGLKTASGYVYSGVDNEASDARGISRTRSMTTMKVSNGTAGQYKETFLDSEVTGTTGKFRIWNNNITDYNFVCHFVPFYQLKYNANGGSGDMAAIPATPVSCEESAANRTVTVAANAFTAPTGKQFVKWNTANDGNGDDVAAGEYVLTSDVTLYAIWEDIDYTVTVNQSPAVSATTTGQTDAAHYNGTINLTTTVPAGYAFVNWTSSDVTITNETSATTASFTMPAKNVTVTANFAAVYTVTLNAGTGSVSAEGWAAGEGVWTKTQSAGSEALTLPDATIGVTGWSFSGWKTGSAVTTETNVKPSFVNKTYTPASDITLYAVYEKTSGGTAVDEIDRDFIGVTSSSYTEWSAKNGSASSAVYAGQSAGGDSNSGDAIQFRSKDSNSGLVTTTSGGKAKKVTVTWNSYTTNDRTLDIYGKGTAYTDATDLYATATQGTKLGSIVKGTSTELTITGDYEFIGMRSNNGAMYLLEIDIEWSTASSSYYSNPTDKVTLTYDKNGASAGDAPAAVPDITIGDKVTVAAKPAELAKAGYTFGGWNTNALGTGTNYEAGTDEITMNDNTTLYAKWTINKHTVSVSAVADGNITATPTGASAIAEGGNDTEVAYGTIVTLAQTNEDHYSFGGWNVTAGGNTVTVTENQFTMPDADVTVSAIFNENAYRTVKFYNNGTQIGESQKVYVGEAPVAATAVYDDCLGESNLFYGWATESWDNSIATLAGKTVITGNMPNVEGTDPDPIEYYAVWAKVTGSASPLFSWAGGASSALTTAGAILSGNGSDYAAGNAPYLVKLDGDGDAIVIPVTSAISSVAVGVKMVGGSSTSHITVQEAADKESTFTDVESLEISGAQNDVLNLATTNDFNADSRAVKLLFAKGSGSNVGVGPITINGIAIYSDFRTNCCTLKPVTGLSAVVKDATTVTLSWTKPESTDGISKYQVLDSDDNVLVNNITDLNATSVDVEGLTSCETYVLRVVSYSSACSVASSTVETTPSASSKTVTFNYNGGSGATESISTTCSVTSITLPTPNDRDGYNFKGWYNGDDKIGDAGASYAPTGNITLLAHWAQLFTVSYDLAGATNIDEIASAQYEEDATVTLTDQVPNKGIMASFKAWSFSPSVTMVDATHFTMPSSDVTITATYNGVGAGKWILVDDADEVTAGSYIIIAAADYNYAISTTQNNNNRGQQSISKSNDKSILTYETAPAIFRVEDGEEINEKATVAFYDGNGYIYAASSSSNHLKTQTTNNANGMWTVAVNESGEATIIAQGTNTRNVLRYNNGSSIFSCYGSSSSESAIALYKFYENVPTVTYYSNTGGDELENFPKEQRTVKNALTDKYEATVIEGPTRYMFEFAGWFDNEDGTGDAYTGTIEVDGDNLDLYAKWTAALAHHITYNTSGSAGDTPTDATDYYEGAEVTLASGSGLSNPGHFFDGWNVTYVNGESVVQTVSVEEGKFTMPDYNVTATAKWAPKSDDKWLLVTSADLLEVDGEYAIVGATAKDGKYYAMSKTQNNNNRGVAEVEYDDDNLVGSSSMAIFTLKAGTVDDTWAFYDPANTGYIYAASSNSNHLKTQAENDANGSWEIDFTSGTTITAQGSNSRNILKYNSGSDIFSCYGSGQKEVKLYKKKAVVRVEDDMNISTVAAGADVIIESGATLTVNSAKEINDLTVKAGGEVVLDEDKLTVVGTFAIETSMATQNQHKSGQLTGATASNFAASGEAYIDITLGASGTNQQWHAFTVPFPVDVMNGIYDLDGNKLNNEVNYAIMEYFGDIRATGAYGWKKIRTTLVPGTFYIMATDGYRTTYRFKKKAGEPLVAANSKDLAKNAVSGDGEDDVDNGWNGVGNPTLMYGKVDHNVYVLDPDIYDYVAKPANSTNFVVGTPFFIQAEGDGSMSMLAAGEGANYAPARVQAKEIKNVDITFGNEVYTDHLYISASEDALNEYQTGKDLVRLSMNNTPRVGRIFCNAYGHELTMVYAPMRNDNAVYDLSLFAPQAGEYTIAAPEETSVTIYLTKNGRIFWNLTMGACELELNQGQNNEYGLVLRAEAPAVTTGIENGELLNGENGVQKVVIDEHVYILRGGEMYDMTGKAVK